MKRTVLLSLLMITAGIVFALSSYTDSDLVSLDTVPPLLELLSPNGGEAWYIGDTRDIIWTASDLNLDSNSVNLWYSLSGGSEYQSLAEALAHTGTYAWELPAVQSYNARVRVAIADNFGNQAQKSSATNFSITYVPPAVPIGLSVDTSDNLHAHLTWDAVTQTIPPYNSPITPDGYIVLYNETPYEDDRLYYFLGSCPDTSYTHHNVVQFRSQMFYKVLAYKLFSREEAFALESLSLAEKSAPILWRDALHSIRQGGTK